MPKPPTKIPSFKSKKNLTKFYVTSEVFSSADLPPFVTEHCHKEKASYRYHRLEKAVDPDDLKRAQEIVRETKNITVENEEGERKEVSLDFISYDRARWRHYFQPKTIEELISFTKDVGFEFSLTNYDPAEDEEELEKYLEMEIGTPLPEEPIVLVKMIDGFMVEGDDDDEEGCGDPNCPDCNPKD